MIESHAVADYPAQIEFESLVGNEKLEDQTGARCEFTGQEQEHAAPANVAGFATIIRAVTADEYRDVNGNGGRVTLPSPRVFLGAGVRSGIWWVVGHRPMQCLAPEVERTIGRR